MDFGSVIKQIYYSSSTIREPIKKHKKEKKQKEANYRMHFLILVFFLFFFERIIYTVNVYYKTGRISFFVS